MTERLQWVRPGRTAVGTLLTIDHPAVVELAANAALDWLWLDAEHGSFTESSAATACAITAGRVPTLLRIPDKQETTLKRYLDVGADGIIVPQVSSLEECRAIADAALYPPAGRRSVGLARAQDYGSGLQAALRRRSYAITVQIETTAGVAAADRIAVEPYIDAVLIGPYDLSGSYGVPGDVGCATVQEAILHVLSACRRAGKPCGIFAGNAEAARTYIAHGFDLVAHGADVLLLRQGFSSLRQQPTLP